MIGNGPDVRRAGHRDGPGGAGFGNGHRAGAADVEVDVARPVGQGDPGTRSGGDAVGGQSPRTVEPIGVGAAPAASE